MKRVLAICLMSSLSACAGIEGKNASLERNDAPPKQLSSNEFDQDYMAKVERQASRNGVIVKWVSPPKARKARKDGQ
jgi:hypothetical protein